MAVLVTVALADLYTHGAPSRAFGALTDDQRNAGIAAAVAEAYGAFRSRGQGDLIAWDVTCTKMVCQIAAYDLMCTIGFNPNAGADMNYLTRATTARAWLKSVSRGEFTPDLTFATLKAVGSMPQVCSKPKIGW